MSCPVISPKTHSTALVACATAPLVSALGLETSGGGWFGIFFQRSDCRLHGALKSFRTPGHDLAVDELPADAMINEERIDRTRKVTGQVTVVGVTRISSKKELVEGFDEFVNLEPLAAPHLRAEPG
jgi:hypothetical protein